VNLGELMSAVACPIYTNNRSAEGIHDIRSYELQTPWNLPLRYRVLYWSLSPEIFRLVYSLSLHKWKECPMQFHIDGIKSDGRAHLFPISGTIGMIHS
jgi:hypothetical protein